MDQLTADTVTDHHPTLADRIAHRRHQLAIYRVAYAETYGRWLPLAKLEGKDERLAALLAEANR